MASSGHTSQNTLKICDKTQYKDYSKMLFELGKNKTTSEIQDEMETIELFISKWEKDNLKNENPKIKTIKGYQSWLVVDLVRERGAGKVRRTKRPGAPKRLFKRPPS